MLKKIISSSLVISAMGLCSSSVFASGYDPSDLLKEVSPGVYTSVKPNTPIGELQAALRVIYERNTTDRHAADHKKNGDQTVTPNDGVIGNSGTDYTDPGYGFTAIEVDNYVNWTDYPTYASWTYETTGLSTPHFADGMVTNTVGLYGLTTNWPPVYQSYSHSSNWVTNSNVVAVSGNDWGFGAWAYATTSANFEAAASGTGSYHTWNW